jgi:hypothetical protein
MRGIAGLVSTGGRQSSSTGDSGAKGHVILLDLFQGCSQPGADTATEDAGFVLSADAVRNRPWPTLVVGLTLRNDGERALWGANPDYFTLLRTARGAPLRRRQGAHGRATLPAEPAVGRWHGANLARLAESELSNCAPMERTR